MTANPPHGPEVAARRGEGRAQQLQQERPRLVALATRVLGDAAEAQDIVQQAWLRLDATDQHIESLPAWLTTVTTRLCLDRLSPNERVAFVMHDSFGFEFTTIAAALDTTEQAARKLASRARAKVAQPRPEDPLADWEVVDAFMTAAREGDFSRLVELLAPDAVVRADAQAIETGTPAAIDGRQGVASFFNGAAHAALPVGIDGRAGSAWYDRGTARVLFDLTVVDGLVTRIDFRADPAVMARVVRRKGAWPR
ncbi:MAG: RNA polymerase subunit sigma-70 [Brachybacterium sp.]|nr:RNA polymerase subunit sigma-70 [Brachybacterium sp.]MDN6302278.1 RNA polymerase subunit sigma-70 [Brachybacterium sp.]